MQFAQPVIQSEIIALIQRIAGIVMVDLNFLYDSEKTKDLSNLIPEKINDFYTINPEGI